jgi:hypothetical protein
MLTKFKISSFNNFKNSKLYFNNSTPKYFFRISLKQNDATNLDNFPERKRRKDNLYLPKQTLIFKEGQIKLLSTTDSDYVNSFNKQRIYLKSITITLSSCFIMSTIMGSSYITIALIAGFSLISNYIRMNTEKNMSRLVKDFSLLEDGKSVEIETITKKFKIDIKLLNKPNKIQAQALRTLNPDLANITTPFIVEKGEHKGFYYIPPDVSYMNKEEIISAIMNNSYINVTPENNIDSKKKVIEKN